MNFAEHSRQLGETFPNGFCEPDSVYAKCR